VTTKEREREREELKRQRTSEREEEEEEEEEGESTRLCNSLKLGHTSTALCIILCSARTERCIRELGAHMFAQL